MNTSLPYLLCSAIYGENWEYIPIYCIVQDILKFSFVEYELHIYVVNTKFVSKEAKSKRIKKQLQTEIWLVTSSVAQELKTPV